MTRSYMIQRISEWIRWLRRIDWELVDVEQASRGELGNIPQHYYFYETWRDKRTGKVKITRS